VTDAPLRARFATHPFQPRCLRWELERHLDEHGEVDRGAVVKALVGLLHDIDHGACPRCQGPSPIARGETAAGSRVTSCRCIPICAECEARETREALTGVVYSVFDWFHDRDVLVDVERDLAELDASRHPFVTNLTSVEDREYRVG
jgi:hypothetical protein